MLVQEYCEAIEIYLQNPHWSGSLKLFGAGSGLSSVAQDTIERLDALDVRRLGLRQPTPGTDSRRRHRDACTAPVTGTCPGSGSMR